MSETPSVGDFNKSINLHPLVRLLISLLAVAVLFVFFYFNKIDVAIFPCIQLGASSLGLAIIVLLLFQLLWRFCDKSIYDFIEKLGNSVLKALLSVLYPVFKSIHIKEIPTYHLTSLVIFLITAVWILLLSPLSLFPVSEEIPIIENFSIRYIDGTITTAKPGDIVEIIGGDQIRVSITTSAPTNLHCTWSSVSGNLRPNKGCSITYFAPFIEVKDTLVALVESPCETQQASVGLHIKILHDGK